MKTSSETNGPASYRKFYWFTRDCFSGGRRRQSLAIGVTMSTIANRSRTLA